jgi:hypothetical protein
MIQASASRNVPEIYFDREQFCSEQKKSATVQSNSGRTSVQRTAVSNASSSEGSAEVEIEIPGDFDNIDSFENSSNINDDSGEYVRIPKLEKWIGLDWDDVSITSDVCQNRKDWLNGVTEPHLAC